MLCITIRFPLGILQWAIALHHADLEGGVPWETEHLPAILCQSAGRTRGAVDHDASILFIVFIFLSFSTESFIVYNNGPLLMGVPYKSESIQYSSDLTPYQ